MNKRKIFNDPVHGFITVPSELLFDIIEHPFFQRLRRIRQLGLTDYVYPGALHTRFHHALGALHLMRRAISILRVKGHKITRSEELGAYVAILLHDIGHGPFSHTLENSLIRGVSHENISALLMERLNREFKGRLSKGIAIFEGSYPKRFLHQLVSSQLDMDRLDYLTRDSFFTGVSEGIINYDRIIDMLEVRNDSLVVEYKGIYSIEKFLIARRLMYWQVYLHKTVLCAEHMLMQAIARARELCKAGEPVQATPDLLYFLSKNVRKNDFVRDPEALDRFTRLDDVDIMAGLKVWMEHPDPVLSSLSQALINRRLFKISLNKEPYSVSKCKSLLRDARQRYGLTEKEAGYFVFWGSTRNYAYRRTETNIDILFKDGRVADIAKASDQFHPGMLSKPVVKHFLVFPKELQM